MSLNTAQLEYLASRGMSLSDVIELSRLGDKRPDPTNVDRQARYREKRNGRKVTALCNGVTPPNEYISNPPEIPPIGISDEIPSPVDEIETQVLKPEHLVEAYNAMADRTGLPKAIKLEGARLRQAKLLVRKATVDDLTEAIDAIERNPWMHGQNERGWRADFDFLLQPKSFTRLIEGSYDRAQ